MHVLLLQWALVSFLIALAETFALVPTYVFAVPAFTRVITNPGKLKSSHLDFLMMSFALCLVFVIEWATHTYLPTLVLIPLIFGSIGNPLLFLYEATPLIRHPLGAKLFPIFMMVSCGSILFSWSAIGYLILPIWALIVLVCLLLSMTCFMMAYSVGVKKQHARTTT